MSILTTLVSPIERYVWGAALIAIVSFGVYEHHHLIVEGEAKIEAADKAHIAEIAAKDQKIQQLSQDAENQVSTVYEKAVSIPAVGDVGLECVRSKPSTSAATPAGCSGSKDPDSSEQSGQGVFDPSGAILTLLRDDDAQIEALISTVTILQNENAQLRSVK